MFSTSLDMFGCEIPRESKRPRGERPASSRPARAATRTSVPIFVESAAPSAGGALCAKRACTPSSKSGRALDDKENLDPNHFAVLLRRQQQHEQPSGRHPTRAKQQVIIETSVLPQPSPSSSAASSEQKTNSAGSAPAECHSRKPVELSRRPQPKSDTRRSLTLSAPLLVQ